MIVNILEQKYKVGCERGMIAFEDPEVVHKLNTVIDWDKCGWPEDRTLPKITKRNEIKDIPDFIMDIINQSGTDILDATPYGIDGKIIKESDGKYYTEIETYPENKQFLGPEPSLKPGDCFEFQGQIIAIDKNKKGESRLVLVVSETGPGALERIYKEHINLEYSIFHFDSGFDLQITSHKLISPEDCLLIEKGNTDFSELFSKEESEDLLDNMWGLHKIDPQVWRLLKKNNPELVDLLTYENKLIEFHCCPNFEEITMWIDCKGRLVYCFGELDSEEFDLILPCIYPGIYNYFISVKS